MNSFAAKGVGSMSLRLLVLAAVSAAFAIFLGAPAGAQPTVVMSGLDNPRGLTFGPACEDDDDEEGDAAALYVAEAGTGGTGNCAIVRGLSQCVGATGAVSRYWQGAQERVVTGLPSYAPANGASATGPHDVSFTNCGHGYVAIGLHGNPGAIRGAFGDGFGWIVRFRPSGVWSYDVDVSDYEIAVNPGGGPVDSNPHGLLAGAGRDIVVEAGGNVLLGVDKKENISTLAVFPSRAQGRSTDSVTSSVAVGPDGAYYVGELTGVPFAVGAARVYRVVPGQAPQIHLEGFTAIIDLDFDQAGNLYVLELATGPGLSGPGALTQVAPNGDRTVIATGLTRPTSVAIGPDCNAYLSHFGTSAGIGEVIRIDLGCPAS